MQLEKVLFSDLLLLILFLPASQVLSLAIKILLKQFHIFLKLISLPFHFLIFPRHNFVLSFLLVYVKSFILYVLNFLILVFDPRPTQLVSKAQFLN